jgi:S-adenosylmethionine decarboxylase
MNGLGRHLLLELREAEPETLNDVEEIKRILMKAAEEAGATIIDYTFRKFSPQGVSGVVVIAESHLSIHTWPEYGYAAVDIFTCGDSLKPEKAVSIIVEATKSKNPMVIEVKRGILSYKNLKYPHKTCEKDAKTASIVL